MAVITPKPMSGFPELMPEEQIVFNRCFSIIRSNFERFGFAPIETPAVERKEVLTSKGADDKEIYALARLAAGPDESADTEFALHFDLTVPLARYVAQHKDKLVFPFRRYQMQKVWRGERPAKGRYRELYQCDIDVIGRGSVAVLNDAEIPSIIYRIFTEMGIGKFVIRLNNRRVLQGFYTYLGVSTEQIPHALRAVDKLEKIGRDNVMRELTEKLGFAPEVAQAILDLAGNTAPTDEIIGILQDMPMMDNPLFAQGVQALSAVVNGVRSLGVPDEAFRVDLSIARGLGYYTGTVYETRLIGHEDLGSICSGGRYDDLASYFTNEKLPGVGISIGLSRLIFALLERGVLKAGAPTTAQVLVTVMDAAQMPAYLKMAAELRDGGINTEMYFEKGRIGDQLKYANRKGHRVALIAGESEFAANQIKAKLLSTGEERVLDRADFVDELKAILC